MQFNPTISLKQGTIAKKIAMENLIPFSRDIASWSVESFKGGAKFQNGDTIMARITPCLENGKHAYVSILSENEVAFGSTEYIVMRGTPNVSDSLFVYYLSLCPHFKNVAISSMVGSSGRQRVQIDVLKNLVFCLPDITEQRRIASILSSLDDKISVNNKICENLEAQAQALFKHWFIDFAPFKDGKFVESELGMIPEGWRVGRLGEIAEFKRGRTITKSDTIEGEIPVVAGGLEPAYYHNKSNTSSRVITVSGSGANAGFTRMYFQPVWASDCSFVDNESTSYLHTAFCFLLVYKKKVDALKWGAAQPHVYAKDINKLSFAIPQIDVLSHFEELVTPFFDYMEKCKRESSRLSTLRDTLLPRLMSGQIKL